MQMTRFINTQPRQRLPLAYVRRGEILMDLGRFDEALDHFERVLAEYPLDIASFPGDVPGRSVRGRAKSSRSRRAGLAAGAARPASRSLGQRMAGVALRVGPAAIPDRPHHAGLAELRSAAQNPNSEETRPRPLAAYDCLDDAIRRLEEFVARYPKRPESPEARFLLAKSLRERATLPRYQLKRAETDNARKELTAKIQSLLTEAENQLETLIDMLQAPESAGLLDPLEQRMIRDACFERAHNLYALEKYDRAIEAYTNAANRYAEDPGVLLAYIQMANCYDRLGKPIDARGVAIQAMLIQKNMPEKAFTRDKTLMSRDEWRTWLEWAGSLRRVPRRNEPAPARPSTACRARAASGRPCPAMNRPTTIAIHPFRRARDEPRRPSTTSSNVLKHRAGTLPGAARFVAATEPRDRRQRLFELAGNPGTETTHPGTPRRNQTPASRAGRAMDGPPRDGPAPRPRRECEGIISETEAILAELVQTEKEGAEQLGRRRDAHPATTGIDRSRRPRQRNLPGQRRPLQPPLPRHQPLVPPFRVLTSVPRPSSRRPSRRRRSD